MPVKSEPRNAIEFVNYRSLETSQAEKHRESNYLRLLCLPLASLISCTDDHPQSSFAAVLGYN